MTSFLQLLEMERKSCTIVVTRGYKKGHLYLKEGQMVDAEYLGIYGLEAAYVIIAWEDSEFRLAEEQERNHRITHSLGHIILSASAKSDEEKLVRSAKAPRKEQKTGPDKNRGFADLVKSIQSIPGVKHYYLLNRQGKMITQSTQNRKIGDFIAYCIVSGMQMREVLEAGRLNHIKIRLADSNILLIVHGGGMNIGLLLKEDTSLSEVFSSLRQAVEKTK